MLSPRWRHTATLLHDGSVLLAGGVDRSGLDIEPPTAEIFDTKSKTFRAVGPMLTNRLDHTATLLNDGKVLLAGGYEPVSAELYDPLTETFRAVGPMITPRFLHRATLLQDGTVLITGGVTWGSPYDAREALRTAEIFDPRTESFGPAGTMAKPRQQHAATLLSDGKVLVAGGFTGWNSGRIENTVELFTVQTRAFSRASDLLVGRAGDTAILLDDDRVLFIGANCSPLCLQGTYEIYAPIEGPVQHGTVPISSIHRGILLLNGNVLLVTQAGDVFDPPRPVVLFNIRTESWTYGPPLVASQPGVLQTPTLTLLRGGNVLITGGNVIMRHGFPTLRDANLYIANQFRSRAVRRN